MDMEIGNFIIYGIVFTLAFLYVLFRKLENVSAVSTLEKLSDLMLSGAMILLLFIIGVPFLFYIVKGAYFLLVFVYQYVGAMIYFIF